MKAHRLGYSSRWWTILILILFITWRSGVQSSARKSFTAQWSENVEIKKIGGQLAVRLVMMHQINWLSIQRMSPAFFVPQHNNKFWLWKHMSTRKGRSYVSRTDVRTVRSVLCVSVHTVDLWEQCSCHEWILSIFMTRKKKLTKILSKFLWHR